MVEDVERIIQRYSEHNWKPKHEPDVDKGMPGSWREESIIKASREAQLLPEIEIGRHDIVIPNNRYSAFHKTKLERKLKEHRVEDIV